jgi:hypothetical protein
MSYGKVHDAYWESDRIQSLSDQAALLGLYLITGSHRNAIGCFRLGIGAITDDPRFNKWGIEGVSKALLELENIGFIVRDNGTGWTFITNTFKHDPIRGFKSAIHAVGLARKVPVKSPVYLALFRAISAVLNAELKGHSDIDGYPLDTPSHGASDTHDKGKPSPSPLPLPSPLPSPIQGSSPSANEHGENPDLEIPISLDRTDEAEALRAYNALAEKIGLPVCQKFTSQRRLKLKKRLEDCGGIAGWMSALAKVEAIPGMRGESNGSGHESWRCNLDFLLTEAKFIKLMEGAYDHWGKQGSGGWDAKPEPRDKILKRIAFYEEKRRKAAAEFEDVSELDEIIRADRARLEAAA